MFSSRNNGKKWAFGALIAGTIGFLVGILTAPKSGRETRDDMKEATRIAIRQAEKDLKAAHTDLRQLITKASTTIKTTSKQAKKDIEKAVGRAKKAQAKVKEILSSIHEGTSDDPELKAALDEANAAKTHLKKFISAK